MALRWRGQSGRRIAGADQRDGQSDKRDGPARAGSML